jgi:glycosyltransferase involved in cell wall biosynthesis
VAAALGRMAARFARVPIVIYTAHGFYFHDLMPAWMRRTHIWIEKLLCRWCTHALFTQSAEDRDTAIQEKLLQRDRIFWIGNGVDVTAFSTSPRLDLRAELELLPADLVVGFIGRLVREKGVEELLEAMGEVITRVPTAKLLIVGDTLDSDRDRRTRKYMKGIIQRTNLEAAVKFAGFRVDIPQLLSTMDLLVLPSHREGMPRTILEAMASGKPVVATDIRGCREEVVDGGTGFLVPVKNPLALAEAIVRLLTNKEEASRMGEAGRRRAREKFDEKKVVERQLEIYRELLNQTKGTGGA